MSTSGITYDEMSEAVTGFDEIAVQKHMDMDLYTDGERRPIWLLRSLVFVHLRHQGATDTDAKEQVLGMPLREINDYFDSKPANADDPDGIDAQELETPDPGTASGKGESQPTVEPLPSPTFA